MGRNHFISIARSILLILLLVTTGCATTSSLSGDFNPDDPYEKSNRKVFEFNNKIDKIRKEKFTSTFPEYSKLFV